MVACASGFSDVMKGIKGAVEKIRKSPASSIPEKYDNLLKALETRSASIVISIQDLALELADEIGLSLFHDVGHIIFHKRSGVIVTNPQVFSKVVALFVANEFHVDNLTGYVTRVAKQSVFTSLEVTQIIDGMMRRLSFTRVPLSLLGYLNTDLF
jgi:hypothetical protein